MSRNYSGTKMLLKIAWCLASAGCVGVGNPEEQAITGEAVAEPVKPPVQMQAISQAATTLAGEQAANAIAPLGGVGSHSVEMEKAQSAVVATVSEDPRSVVASAADSPLSDIGRPTSGLLIPLLPNYRAQRYCTANQWNDTVGWYQRCCVYDAFRYYVLRDYLGNHQCWNSIGYNSAWAGWYPVPAVCQ